MIVRMAGCGAACAPRHPRLQHCHQQQRLDRGAASSLTMPRAGQTVLPWRTAAAPTHTSSPLWRARSNSLRTSGGSGSSLTYDGGDGGGSESDDGEGGRRQLLSDEEEEQARHDAFLGEVAASQDWLSLQRALATVGPDRLAVHHAQAVMRRASQLVASQGDGDGGSITLPGPRTNESLMARSVTCLCCLVVLRDLDQLTTRLVCAFLGALGGLVARGVLPDAASRSVPREMLVTAAQLARRARMASSSGLLGPNQLAGVLRGCALLAPQFLDAAFLTEAEMALLAHPGTMSRLAPDSVAALMTAITQGRRGRLRKWQPSPEFVHALQDEITGRITDFSGFELATTLYGLVELTTNSNSHGPALVPAAVVSTLEAAVQPTGKPSGPGGASTTPSSSSSKPPVSAAAASAMLQHLSRYAPLREEQERIERMRAARRGGLCSSSAQRQRQLQQQAGSVAVSASPSSSVSSSGTAGLVLQQQLLDEVREWEQGCWQRTAQAQQQQQQQQQQAGASKGGSQEEDHEEECASPAWEVALQQEEERSHGNGTRAVNSMDLQEQAPAFGACAGGEDTHPEGLAPRDLALLLVAYTRLGLPGFSPGRPLYMGMLPLEVLHAELEMGVTPTVPEHQRAHDDDEDEDEEP